MSIAAVKSERALYPFVSRWLRGEGYYCGHDQWIRTRGRNRPRPYTNLGLRDTRLDVLGVRSVGSDFHDELEIAAVEVKRGDGLSVQHLNQAAGYARYVDRCYFAKPGAYTDAQIQEALRLGLGLLTIQARGRPRVRVVLDAGISKPHPHLKTQLLHKLWLHQCTLCRVFFFAYQMDVDGRRDPTYYVIEREAEVPRIGGATKIKSYLCAPCAERLGFEKVITKRGKRWKRPRRLVP